jgi:hypothetical protein
LKRQDAHIAYQADKNGAGRRQRTTVAAKPSRAEPICPERPTVYRRAPRVSLKKIAVNAGKFDISLALLA